MNRKKKKLYIYNLIIMAVLTVLLGVTALDQGHLLAKITFVIALIGFCTVCVCFYAESRISKNNGEKL